MLLHLLGCLPALPDDQGATDTAVVPSAEPVDLSCVVTGTDLAVSGTIVASTAIEKVSITVDASSAVWAEYPETTIFEVDAVVDGTPWADGSERTAALWVRLADLVDAVQVGACTFTIAAPCADADLDTFLDSACGGEDCDDTDAAVFPGAAETCNERDDDCDAQIDEDPPTWTFDGDADGYGDDEVSVVQCDAPTGFVAAGGDCDDGDAGVHPGADEPDCTDPTDYNCDGSVGYADADEDGFAACVECDDADAGIRPDAKETCDDVDEDCDGAVDEDATDATEWYGDGDGDGYGGGSVGRSCDAPAGAVAGSGDCDDTSAAVHPGVDDPCDEFDNDCDGETDEDPNQLYFVDADGDGWGDSASPTYACGTPAGHSSASGDCDDTDGAIHPGVDDGCDEVDSDCDGTIDEDPDITWYADADGDGHGDADTRVSACDGPAGHVLGDWDCDDADADTHPEAREYCDELDSDCDGEVDEEDSVDATEWFTDADGDGYGTESAGFACDAPAGAVAEDGDCDDADAAVALTCGAGGLIVYTSAESGYPELWTAELDAFGAKQLTDDAASYGKVGAYGPRFSPEGETIAFVYAPSSLMLVDVPTGTLTELATVSSPSLALAWSVDGTTVYFDEGGDILYAADVATGAVTILDYDSSTANYGYVSDLDGSTGQLTMLAYHGGGEYRGFYSYDLDSGAESALGFGDTTSWITGPGRYDPTYGTFAYIFSERFGTGDKLLLADPDTAAETTLLDLSAGTYAFDRDRPPAWTPDGVTIFVTMYKVSTGQNELHAIDVATGADKTIFADATNDYQSADVRWAEDADEDGYTAWDDGGSDCDDADANVFPGAAETCNGYDEDCDGEIDEGDVCAAAYIPAATSRYALALAEGGSGTVTVASSDDWEVCAGEEFTLELWASVAYDTTGGAWQDLFWLGAGGGDSLALRTNASSARFVLHWNSDATGDVNYEPAAPTLGGWHFFAVQFTSDGTPSIWIDGVELGGTVTTRLSGCITAGTLSLAGSPPYEKNGTYGWVRVSDVARYSSAYVGVPSELRVDEHTLAAWTLDQSTGTSVTDESGRGHTGTVSGTYSWTWTSY